MTLVLTADSTAPLGVRWAEYVPPGPPLPDVLVNLALRPSFEVLHEPHQVIYTNEFEDPKARSLAGWQAFSPAGGILPTFEIVNSPDFASGTCLRITFHDSAPFQAVLWHGQPIPAGVISTFQATMRSPNQPNTVDPEVDLVLSNGPPVNNYPTASNGEDILPGAPPVRMYVDGTKAGYTDPYWGVGMGSGKYVPTPGLIVEVSDFGLILQSAEGSDYPHLSHIWFDGDTVDPDFTFAWLGTPGASKSTMSAMRMTEWPLVTGLRSYSPSWHLSGAGSMRLPGQGGGHLQRLSPLVKGTVYTMFVTVTHNLGPGQSTGGDMAITYDDLYLGIPKEPGTYRMMMVFTGGNQFQSLNLGGAAVWDVWYDDLMVLEGDWSAEPWPAYFDGDTPDKSNANFTWDGTPHDSTSRRVKASYVFKVTDIPGLLAWIDPSASLLADGEPVLAYRDATGREFSADGAAPTFRTFPNRIEFSGGGLVAPDVNLGSDGLTFVAVSQVDAPSGAPMITWGTADLGYDEADPIGTRNLHIERVASGYRTDVLVNGALTQSQAGIQEAVVQTLSIGTGFTGTILEAVVVAGPISDYDLGLLTDYLANKYELTGV